jgi:SAM-dependent methyltransferase
MKKLFLAAGLLLLVVLTVPLWKPIAKKSKWFIVATNIYQDALRRLNLRSDQIGGEPVADAHLAGLNQINRTFERYLKYSGLTRETLANKTVLEIGPGDNVGVALRFLAAGAKRVVCIDKFVHYQESPVHQRLYRALREGLPPEDRARFDQVISLDNGVKLDTKRLEWVYGKGIEDTDSLFKPGSFDVIVSAAVLEELYDIDLAFSKMDRLLAPGGYTIHKIDMRDYEMFHKHGFHRLEFLTVPDPIYRHMSQASGQPNRRLVNYYRDKMTELHYDSTIFIAMAATGDEFKELPEYKTKLTKGVDYTEANLESYRDMRPRLLPRYQSLSDDDLITEAILLTGRKPASAHTADKR